MQFSYLLKFNVIPKWSNHYVSYSTLKRIISKLDVHLPDIEAADPEKSILDPFTEFHCALDEQLDKVTLFYAEQETHIYLHIERLDLELKGMLDGDDEDDQDTMSLDSNGLDSLKTNRKCLDSQHDVLDSMLNLKKQLVSIYASLVELESFTLVNLNIFEEVWEKYKKTKSRTKMGDLTGDDDDDMIKKIRNSKPFMMETLDTLRHQIHRLESIYAEKFCKGFRTMSTVDQIKIHLQQQALSTLDWRNQKKRRNQLSNKKEEEGYDADADDDDDGSSADEQDDDDIKTINNNNNSNNNHDDDDEEDIKKKKKYYKIPWSNYRIASTHLYNIIYFMLACFLFMGLLCADIFHNRQENYCFALLIFAAVLWATEAIPLYATSYIIPFLIVTLGIMIDSSTNTPMSAKQSAKAVFGAMFSGTILMLLSGFALAAALSKYGIAKAFATHVLSRAGTRPHWVLLSIMFVAGFLSMFISNVATPVLCFSLIESILRSLSDDNGARVGSCLILGIALASNIGGMTSPISSPQNIITIQYLRPTPGWGIWMVVALPIAILSILVCWGILLFVYKPSRDTRHLSRIKHSKETMRTWRHIFIIAVTFITIGLWCAESGLEGYIGDTGVIATLPLFLFFSTGILKKEDLHRFLWSVVVLAQGGMALGSAVTSSGLLQDIALGLKENMMSLSPFVVLMLFSGFILVFSTFVSHTVAALIIVPIVKEVGEKLPIPHPNLFVMGAGLACSAGMGLPVSGFPNMSAVMLERTNGKTYLTTRDFIVTGIPTSIICTLLIFTLGYGIMSLIGY